MSINIKKIHFKLNVLKKINSLIRSNSINAGCSILASKVSSNISGALINVKTASWTLPIFSALTSECVEHVKASSTILTWIAIAVVFSESLSQICDLNFEISDTSLKSIISSSISCGICRYITSRSSIFQSGYSSVLRTDTPLKILHLSN